MALRSISFEMPQRKKKKKLMQVKIPLLFLFIIIFWCFSRFSENKERRGKMQTTSLFRKPPSEQERLIIHEQFLRTVCEIIPFNYSTIVNEMFYEFKFVF